jgi:MFS family permease
VRPAHSESVSSDVAAAQSESSIPDWRELFVGGLARTTAGLLLMEGLVAVQVLVTVAVLPAVVSDLGGVRLYGAALSAPQVATVVVLPFTPRLVKWWGLRGAFYASLSAFVAGGLLVISAPEAWIFVSGLVVQGAGSGAQYALLLAVFTRRYPLRLRPRMYAALAVAWAIPGLLGPAYGGSVASTLGWRWAFALIVPLVVPAVWMLHPSLTKDGRNEPSSGDSPLRTSVLMVFAVSTLTLLAALTAPGRWGVVLVGPMAVAAVAALTRILPKGTFAVRRGLPAVIASGFLANAAFYSVEGFLPAYLTRVAGLTLTVASIVVTCGVLSWTIGTWAQSRLATNRPMARIASLGEALMLIGVGGVVAGVASGVAFIVYVAWGACGLGMGMTYPAIGVLATDVAASGDEVTTLAQYQLGDVLGSAFGPALVGVAVTAAASQRVDLQEGLLIGFSATCALLLAALFASTRLPATSSTRAEPRPSPIRHEDRASPSRSSARPRREDPRWRS